MEAKSSSDRQLTDWLSAYLKYTEETEPPRSYHTWTALSVIAGALQRRVYCRWGHDMIYPNLYVVLVGPSGKCRKGTAMNIGKDLLKDVGLPIASESITREALIRFMSNNMQSYTDPEGAVKFHCSVTCLSPELSVFLGQNDVKFLADLTDWYDCADDWRYETKNKGTDHLQGICFNLLGATAPDWLQSILPQEAVGGGFTSRIIFIVEEKKEKIIARPRFTQEQAQLKEMLTADLQQIYNISGEIEFTDESSEMYSKWYENQESEAEQGIKPVDDPRLTGYMERRATHVKKLAMILSASRSSDKKIIGIDFERAVKLLEAAEKSMHKTFGGLGKSSYSEAVDLVLDYIMATGECTRSELLRKFYRDLDPTSLKVAEEVLEGMRVMRKTIRPQEGEVSYKYIGPGSKEDI